jgi:hypothetical protein
MIRTLRAAQAGRYASFPTVVLDGEMLRVFYRLAAKGNTGTHGSYGRVRCLEMTQTAFLGAFESEHPDRIYDIAQDLVFDFGDDNEMDAICSPMGEKGLLLTTRTFDRKRVMRNFASSGKDLDALTAGRSEVVTPEALQWFAFYGHAVVAPNGQWWFPAYGCLKARQDHQCGFLLESNAQLKHWQVRQVLPEDWEVEVNECSIVAHNDQWYLFLRQRHDPFGIWMTQSADGNEWREPELLCEAGHAPMALSHHGRLYLGFRHILAEDRAATAIMLPLEGCKIHDLDAYEGNIYDGGYCDLAAIKGDLYAFYYHGNEAGEPELKCAKVSTRR